MADLKTTNIYGDAYINNKVGIATNAPATRLQIGQLSPTAATEGIQFGDDTGARLYRDSAGIIKVAGGFTSTSYILAGNYLQTAGNLIYPSSQTATQRLEVGNTSGNAWVTGIAIAQGGNVTVYNNLTVNNAATVTNDLTVNGNTYLGNAGGDTVFVNDIIRIGATDSGDASLFFGEGSFAGSDYGARWYWDSGYTFTWYTRNAGTDTALFDYLTNDTIYLNWRRNFHMQNKEINYNAQIHFNAGTRFVGQSTSHLVFRSDSTSEGGIRVQDGGIATKGYIGYWDSSGGGILNNTGEWALRYNFGSANSGGTLYGAWTVNGNISATGTITAPSATVSGYITFPNDTTAAGLINTAGTAWLRLDDGSGNMHMGNVQSGAGIYCDSNAFYWRTINGATTLLSLNSNGDLGAARYLSGTYVTTSDDTSSTTVSYIMAKFGDNFHRSAPAAKVATFLSGQTMNIVGTSTNITAYTINQSVGTANSPTFAGLTLSPSATSQFQLNSPSATQGLWIRSGYDTDGTATPVASANNIEIQSSGATSGTFSFVCGNTKILTIAPGAVNSLVALQQSGNQVLHAGNVATYALPIGGGTLTGGLSGTSVSTTGATITNLTGAYQNTTVYDSPRTQSATPTRGIRAPASSIQFTDSYAIAPYYTYRSTGDWPVPYGIGWGTGGESSGIFQRYASNGSSFGDMIFYTGNDGSGAFSFRRHTWEGTTYFAAGSGELNTELFRVDWSGNLTMLGTLNGSANSATLYANSGTYGSWKIGGTRNGWHGIEFESGTILMANSSESGFYRVGSGWQMWWSGGTGYVHKGGSGGGTQATILESSNYTSYAPGLGTNNTLTGMNIIYNTSNTVINNQSGNLGLTMFQATAGTDAYMAFHIGSDYAAYFGLGGAENDLVYGGWSVGNVRHRILHSGNAPYAWNMNQYVRTTDSPTFNTVTANITGYAYNNLSNDYKDIYVYGDVNTYYVVLIQGEYLYSFGRYSVTRGYNWTGPNTWNTESHKGGLTLDWEWSGDTAWGGNDKAIRIIEFNESYSSTVAGLGYPVNGGVIIWLRGGGVGGALYRIRTPVGSNSTVTIYDNLSIAGHVASTTFTAANSAVFSTRADLSNVSAEILARYPVRGSGGLFDGNNAVLHAGNYNSYSPTLTGTGASGTWSINVTGNAGTATTLQTARNINGTSFNGSDAITTANWGTARTLTIGSTGKSVDGGAAITWSLAEIGAAATNQTMFIGTTSVAINRASANLALTGITSIDGNAASASSLAANTNTIFKVIRFTGEGYDSGNGASPTSYGIYQQGGSWENPYPDLCIGFHTGIKIGAQTGYGGTRFYNTETWGTEIFSVGNGDNNVRVVNTIYAAAFSGPLTGNVTGNVTGNTSGTAGSISGFNNPAVAATANTIVYRDGSGHIYGAYILGSYFNASAGNSENPTIGQIWTQNTTDNYLRKSTPAHFRSQVTDGSYPSLTGANASGTWSINVTGNAGTATSAVSATSATSATFLNSSNYIQRIGGSGNYNTDFQNTPAGSVRHQGDDATSTNNPGGSWWFVDNYRHSNGSNYWGTQVAWGWEDQANRLATRNVTAGTFGGWVYYLNSANYNSYSPTLTGTGASGTWAINITGNAVTATSATALTSMNISQFTNNSGYLTSVTNISGNAATATSLTNFTNQSGARYTTDFNSIVTTGFFNAEGTPTNSPGGSYGQLISAKGIDTGLQIYGGYTNDNLWFRGWHTSGGTFTAWRTVIHNGNIGSQTVATATGNAGSVTYLPGRTDAAVYPVLWGAAYTNAVGTIAYSCAAVTIQSSTGILSATSFSGAGTGLSGTATSLSIGGNAVTAGGLSVHSGTNNEANKIVRTDGNGYINAGWINTPSGDMPDTQSINRIYCSDDQYIRYKGVADFKQQIGLTYKNATPRSSNTTDTNYWTGIMGWVGTDWNSMADWGCGFVDSWDSPANRPPVGGHHVGIQALHYTNGTARYGWQMANGGANNRWWLRDVWGGSFSTWFEILTSTNYTSFAPSLTGTGASGTWAINITGNADTAGTANALNTSNNYRVTNFGIDTAPANKLHINGDNVNPTIRVDNGAVVLAASAASNSKSFYGWLPISIAGTTRWIQMYSNV